MERTESHDIVAWSRLAEICSDYLRKGSRVYFEGSLQTRSWEDRDGSRRFVTEIRARDMMMLDSGNDDVPGNDYYESRTRFSGTQSRIEDSTGFEPDDDLPF